MKLTAMRGDEAVCVLCDLIDPMTNLMQTPGFDAVLAKLERLGQTNPPPIVFYPLALVTMKPLLKEHQDDLFALAAALVGKTLEDVQQQPLLQTLREVREAWSGELHDFFTSSAVTEKEE